MTHTPDPAAVFAAAKSLYAVVCKAFADAHAPEDEHTREEDLRQCMQIAQYFEVWACHEIEFSCVDGVYVYQLEDHFGPEWLALEKLENVYFATHERCAAVAAALGFPLKRKP